MKKLTKFVAITLLGFGLVSCNDDSAKKGDDKNKEALAQTAQGGGETTETVSIKVTGMT
jgi:hypothetical protein